MPAVLRQFETLDQPVTSPSGVWALWYDANRRAVLTDRFGAVTWSAGAAGTLRLEMDTVFAVYDNDEVVWRAADLRVPSYTALGVTDSGDVVFYDDGLPVHSLLHGPIEPVVLGDRAPVAEIRDNRLIRSASGRRTIHRTADGTGLVCRATFGGGAVGTVVVQPDEVRTLEQPGTWLTWRFLDTPAPGHWHVVLVGPDDEIRWMLGKGHVGEQDEHQSADAEEEFDSDSPEWLAKGLRADSAYCVTVIHDVDPDEALRRFGARDEEISTGTWDRLQRQAYYEEIDVDFQAVAAFALGPHTLLVEDNGFEAVNRPELSRGTFAVSSYSSINADHRFLVSRDGEVLASFDDFYASKAEGADPGVLTPALAAMGIDDIEEFDADDENFLDDIELLCQLSGVRPSLEDVTGPARVAILRRSVHWAAA